MVIRDFEARDVSALAPAMLGGYAPSTPMARGTTEYATYLAYRHEPEQHHVENSSFELF